MNARSIGLTTAVFFLLLGSAQVFLSLRLPGGLGISAAEPGAGAIPRRCRRTDGGGRQHPSAADGHDARRGGRLSCSQTARYTIFDWYFVRLHPATPKSRVPGIGISAAVGHADNFRDARACPSRGHVRTDDRYFVSHFYPGASGKPDCSDLVLLK